MDLPSNKLSHEDLTLIKEYHAADSEDLRSLVSDLIDPVMGALHQNTPPEVEEIVRNINQTTGGVEMAGKKWSVPKIVGFLLIASIVLEVAFDSIFVKLKKVNLNILIISEKQIPKDFTKMFKKDVEKATAAQQKFSNSQVIFNYKVVSPPGGVIPQFSKHYAKFSDIPKDISFDAICVIHEGYIKPFQYFWKSVNFIDNRSYNHTIYFMFKKQKNNLVWSSASNVGYTEPLSSDSDHQYLLGKNSLRYMKPNEAGYYKMDFTNIKRSYWVA
jgi:hypothetical protein